MPLIDSPYSPCIKELLRTLEYDTQISLASTATNNKLLPCTRKEAIHIILCYTEDLPRFFSYRKITSEVLFKYLNMKKDFKNVGDSKQALIEKVKQLWERCVDPKVSPKNISPQFGASANLPALPAPKVSSKTISPQLGASANLPALSGPNVSANTTSLQLGVSSGHIHINLEVTQGQDNAGVRSDVFSRHFCTWFYSGLNNLQGTRHTGDTLSAEDFMSNSTIDIYSYGHQNTNKHASGQLDVYLLLKGTCIDFNLSFVPNLDSGLQAEMSEYGLLKLYCVGTVQQGDALVGIFEQEFGLVQCPQRKWKIMVTKINLKQMQPSACVPSLPSASVFEIPP